MASDPAVDRSLLVRQEIERCLSRRGAAPPSCLASDASLSELGLDSLDLHELVDALEVATGLNPFEQRLALTDMRTVGDLCAAYSPAATTPQAAQDDLLDSSRRRAEARRRGRRG